MKVNIGPYSDDNSDREISVEIDKFDTWNLDHTLALIISKALKQYKENDINSIPGSFFEQSTAYSFTQMAFKFYEDDNELVEKEASKQWVEIVDKMIFSFEQAINEEGMYGEGQFYSIDPHNLKVKVKVNYVELDEHNAKIQEGFDLFAKYYRNLWD